MIGYTYFEAVHGIGSSEFLFRSAVPVLGKELPIFGEGSLLNLSTDLSKYISKLIGSEFAIRGKIVGVQSAESLIKKSQEDLATIEERIHGDCIPTLEVVIPSLDIGVELVNDLCKEELNSDLEDKYNILKNFVIDKENECHKNALDDYCSIAEDYYKDLTTKVNENIVFFTKVKDFANDLVALYRKVEEYISLAESINKSENLDYNFRSVSKPNSDKLESLWNEVSALMPKTSKAAAPKTVAKGYNLNDTSDISIMVQRTFDNCKNKILSSNEYISLKNQYIKTVNDYKVACEEEGNNSDNTVQDTTPSSDDAAKASEVATKTSTDGATNAAATGNPIATNATDANKLASAVAGATNGGAAVVTNMLNNVGVNGFSTISNSTVAKSEFYATGQNDVIRMEYMLLMGNISNLGTPAEPIAYTDSFIDGVSLSEISWGFYNTSSADFEEQAHLKFTIHDIAGDTLGKFFKLRSGAELIYFKGPMSNGLLWPTENWAIYQPITDSCEMTFSPTQGFTYSIVARPIIGLAKSNLYRCPKAFNLNGTYKQTKTVNTFKGYMEEFVSKWNDGLSEEAKATSRINFDWDDDKNGIQHKMWSMPAQVTAKESAGEQNNKDNPIKEHSIDLGANLASSIIDIWQKLFVKTDSELNKGSNLEVNFKNFEGGESVFNIRLHMKDETNEVDHIEFPICVGSDLNCADMIFRAQLVELNFSGLYSVLGAGAYSSSKENNDITQVGNKEEETKKIEGGTEIKPNQTKENSSAAVNSNNPTDSSQEHGFNGWGEMRKLLNSVKTPELTVEVELPYSFAFTPKALGGWMKDALEKSPSSAIHHTQGAYLLFFWYVNSKCNTLEFNDVISTQYRITKVMHTIGLNGNTTQVGLSHLHISI